MKLQVKNWSDFQHYKDRSPAWIKLHRDILDDYEFQSLQVASRALAPMLWLIASESDDGVIDAKPAKLAFRLRMTEDEVIEALSPLISNGFFLCVDDLGQPASNPLASCLPREEKRREEKEREEEERENARKRATHLEKPADVDDQTWSDWLALRKSKKAPVTETVINGARKESEKAGMSLQAFLQVWCTRGSQGLMAEWLRPDERPSRGIPNKQEQLEARNRAVGESWAKKMQEKLSAEQ